VIWTGLSSAVLFRFDPAPHIFGTVDDFRAGPLDQRKESHGGPIDQRDVFEIENDTPGRLGREEFLEPRRVLGVEHPAEREDDPIGLRCPIDSVSQRHPRAHAREQSEGQAKIIDVARRDVAARESSANNREIL
jgi:hypothetical protein